MDIRKVKKLIELLEESNIGEIEIKEGEESVRISRYGNQPAAPVAYAAPAPVAPAPASAPAAAEAPAAEAAAPAAGTSGVSADAWLPLTSHRRGLLCLKKIIQSLDILVQMQYQNYTINQVTKVST